MTPNLVSVIIPTYNYGRFVVDAVESALAQTYPQREVLVIDDGSTDDTRERLAPFGDKIRYIHQKNQGLSAARNTGIRAAEGEFIGLLDSDDLWHPRLLELQVPYLRAHPEIGMLAADYFTDLQQCWPAIDADLSTMKPRVFTTEEMICKTHFAPSTVLIRRSCLDDVGLFDPSLRCVEDRDMWTRFSSRHVIAKLPLPLAWYRLHSTSLSTKAVPMEEAELRVLKKAFAENPVLRGRWLFRRKAYSHATFISAQLFAAGWQWGPALRRVLSSLLLWPLPFPRDEVDAPFIRLRALVNYSLRMLRLRTPTPETDAIDTASSPVMASPAVSINPRANLSATGRPS